MPGNRCPYCNKFVGLENAEPQVNSVETEFSNGRLHITLDYEHARQCADCGSDLKSVCDTAEADMVLEDLDGWTALSEKEQKKLLKDLKAGKVEFGDQCDAEAEESGGSRYQANVVTKRFTVEAITVGKGDAAKKLSAELTADHNASEYEECA